MSHLNNTTKNRKGKHLNYEERIKIETLSKIGIKSEEIAKHIGCSGRTVQRELAKGKTELLNSDLTMRKEYSADIGQQKHDYAAAESIKAENRFKITISYKTIYNYIDNGLFPNLTNKDLPVKKDGKKRRYDKVRTAINNKI